MKQAVVMASGGLDSTTICYQLIKDDFDVLPIIFRLRTALRKSWNGSASTMFFLKIRALPTGWMSPDRVQRLKF